MTQGRTLRVIGAIGLLAGGLLSAVVLVVQFAVLANLEQGASFGAALTATSRIAGGLAILGSVLLIAAYVILALSRGRLGVADRSALPVVGFVVLAVVFLLAQLFFQFAPQLMAATASEANMLIASNRVVNLVLIAALLFAAITMLVRAAVGGFARFALFVPAIVLVLLQFSFLVPYPGYLLTQAAYGLTWVVVGISYLVARPRMTAVTAASENLAE